MPLIKNVQKVLLKISASLIAIDKLDDNSLKFWINLKRNYLHLDSEVSEEFTKKFSDLKIAISPEILTVSLYEKYFKKGK